MPPRSAMKARFLPIALVLAVVVMVVLAFQLGRQGEEYGQLAEQVNALIATPPP